MEKNNKVIAAVFSFRETGGGGALSLLTVDGGQELYELPTGETGADDRSLRDAVARALRVGGEQIQVDPGQLMPVPFEGSYAAVYAAVLPDYPGRPRGTRWIDVSPDGTLPEELAYDHGLVFEASAGMLLDSLVSPSFRLPAGCSGLRARLWEALMPGERKSGWLESLGDLGVSSSALDGTPKTADELKKELTRRKKKELEAKRKDPEKAIPETEQGKFVYDYIHPSLTVDIVVLAVNERGELVLPLTVKDKTEFGAGMWSLPGGFVQLEDYLEAGWDPGKDPGSFGSMLDYLAHVRGGKSVVEVAARRLLRDKAGIELPEGTKLYQLTSDIQDNPRHGSIDGAPIVSRAFLAVIPDYKAFENAAVTSDFVAGPARWFPIRRRLFRGNELVLEEQGEVMRDVAVGVDGKKTALLTYDRRFSDGYIADGKLVIDHFQELDRGALERKAVGSDADGTDRGKELKMLDVYPGRVALGLDIAPGQELFGHHLQVIVDALELIKEKSFSTTIIADFINRRNDPSEWDHPENEISFDHFKKVRDAVKCFDPSVRQNLFDKETAKEYREDELYADLSRKKDKELLAAAAKAGLDTSALEGRPRNEVIGAIVDAMAYRWTDPSGRVHRIKNNGFLVKHPTKSRTYLLSRELYQRFLDLGSTI